jgi:hypothetical protein
LIRGDVVDVGGADRGIDRLVGIWIVDHVQLGATHPGREARPIGAAPVQMQAAGIDQISGIRQRVAQTAVRLAHQLRKQRGKNIAGPKRIGVRKRRAAHRLDAQVIEPRLVALKARHDLAQADRARKLAYSSATSWLFVESRRTCLSA